MMNVKKSVLLFLVSFASQAAFAQASREIAFNEQQAVPLSSIVNQTPGAEGSKKIEILPGEVAYIDKSINVGELVINGQLHCKDASVEIKATTIYVNGHFQCGTSQNPFSGKLYLSLKHSALDPKANFGYRGMIVNNGGRLILNGRTEKSGHYKIVRTVFPGQNSIELERDMRGLWNVGDLIALAPTSYNPDEGEKLSISGFDSSGKIVYFSSSTRFKHWGETEQLATSRGAVTLDQRAEVANLTRNIVIRADESITQISEADIPDGQLGGHVMVHRGGFATIDSVEFYKLGQAGVMARYPFHWHFVGDAPGQFIKNSSIHHSFQRCVTVHQTNQIVVDNNVCFNFKGHGFFLEDGNEINNTITRNLGIGAQFPSMSKILLTSDHIYANVDRRRFPPVSTFWVSNPQNRITKNIAAGSVGAGFWMAFVDEVRRFNSQTGEFDGEVLARPRYTDTLEFSYNTAHSTLVGHTWDGAPIERPQTPGKNPYSPNNPNNAQDRYLEMAHYAPSKTPTFPGLVAYKNLYTGIYFRGDTVVFDNAIFADNGWGAFLAFNQNIRNSVFVGRTKNHSAVEENYMYEQRRYTEKQAGIILYDGPWELDNVDFLNFPTQKEIRYIGGVATDVTTVPMFTIGGTEKLTNVSRNVKFSPEPYYRVYQDFINEVWADKRYTNAVRDLDGTLTGVAGGILLPERNISNDSTCVKKDVAGKETYYGFVVCPAQMEISALWFNSSELGGSNPYLIRRNDGAVTYDKKEWGILDTIGKSQLLHLKAMVPNKPEYTYDVLFSNAASATGKGVGIVASKMTAEKINSVTPLIKISGYGSNCRLNGASRYNSVDELRNVKQGGYYSNGNDFYIKLKTVRNYGAVKPTTGSLTTMAESDYAALVCDGPVINKIVGNIDGITKDASGTYLNGWACDYGKSEEIELHIYAQNGQKQDMVLWTKANLVSDEAVNFACADPTMKNHRFSVKVSDNVLNSYAGAPLFVYGISTSGKENSAISGSGIVRVPGGAATASCSFNGKEVKHGQSVDAYLKPSGTTCQKEVRTCNNGQLSGSYANANCSVVNNPPPTNPNVTNKITGVIDGINTQNGKSYISGWACDYGKGVQIDAHVYIGDGRAQEMIGAFRADQVSEPAVATACADPAQLGHRFAYEIPESIMVQKGGKNIYIFGISTSGKENLQIGNSGTFTVPKKTAPPAVENKITGWVGEVLNENGKSYITGFACDYGKSAQIDAHVYIGSGKVEEFIGAFKANLANNDSAINTTCGDSTGTGHKFKYEIPENVILQKSGKNIYVFGISTSGKENLQIGNSGVFTVPKKTTSTPTPVVENRIEGWFDAVTVEGGKAFAHGWVCDYGKSLQVDAHVYIGNGKAEEMIGAFKANLASEAAVGTACGDNSGLGHRFRYEIPASVVASKKGRNIYIFGISTSGKENRAIGRSGELKVP